MIKTLIMTSKTFIEKDPYMQKSQHSCSCTQFARKCSGVMYKRAKQRRRIKVISHDLLRRGIQVGVLSSELKSFDLEFLGETINPERDLQFGYLGLQTLYDRYFLIDRNDSFSKEGKRIELPQIFFMRVAMGLAIREKIRKRAAEFYNLLSSFDFMSSTPTLFNSGTNFLSYRPATCLQ